MIGFDSYNYATRAEKLLKPHLSVRIMPTLRCVSESCGMALRISVSDGDLADELLRTSELPLTVWRRYLVYDDGSRAEPCREKAE